MIHCKTFISNQVKDLLKSSQLIIWTWKYSDFSPNLLLTLSVGSSSCVILGMNFISLWRHNISDLHFYNILKYKAEWTQLSEIFASVKYKYPNVVLPQSLPKPVRFGVDWHHHVMDRFWHRIFSLQIHPCGEMHDLLWELLHIKWVQCSRANYHLQHTVIHSWRTAAENSTESRNLELWSPGVFCHLKWPVGSGCISSW